ncbi:PAS domain S-box protein [Sinirhodobacter populi]|uniref:PAS domain S-box protein n=1 Tax=Paenirhodobacter populi TaxID=2306993 RepID=A0A443J9A5_9RHOB|nr:PAS domain S-box protein [Sinirhodobacter populi]
MTGTGGGARRVTTRAEIHQIDDILYSRADSDGIIRTVNDAFARFSGHSAAQLAGQSHHVLRDPQTPGAIYDLLWRKLGTRQPTATYLCSRTRAGESYWVLAIVLPLEDGFISLHLPPRAEIFADVPGIYRESVAREDEDRTDPDRNGITLRRLALARGFPGYDSFVACALAQEFAARGIMGTPAADLRGRALSAMTESLVLGMQGQVGLIRSFEGLQLIPNNMQIVASRLEPTGGPVSAIAENYRASSRGISRRLQAFVGHDEGLCELAARGLSHVLILLGAIRMLRDVGQEMSDAERGQLKATGPRLALAAQRAVGETIAASARVSRAGAEIRRHMLALDTIRVLGRVECCRMQEAGGLASTIDQLDVFHAEIRSRLETIVQLSEVIGAAMGEVQAMAIPG